MNIIKCKCSHSIHVFLSEGNAVCPLCGSSVDKRKAIDNSFKKQFMFLNDKLTEIDRLISKSEFNSAKTIINEVLEKAPGPEIGDLPKTGEVYWRKLLAETSCKNDMELLSKGKPLQHYPAFNNAVKYATENEKPVYLLIGKIKNTVLANIKNLLKKLEPVEKQKTGVDNLLNDYRKELDVLQKQVQDNITLLENIEKELCERIIDYTVFIGEFRHSIDSILSKAKSIGNDATDISKKEKDLWIEQLQIYQSQSNQEINNFGKVKTTNQHYLEFTRLEKEQKNKVSNINKNISEIKNLQSKIDDCLEGINQISDKYTNAISALDDGNYKPAIKLITQSRFDEIVKRVITAKQ